MSVQVQILYEGDHDCRIRFQLKACVIDLGFAALHRNMYMMPRIQYRHYIVTMGTFVIPLLISRDPRMVQTFCKDLPTVKLGKLRKT